MPGERKVTEGGCEQLVPIDLLWLLCILYWHTTLYIHQISCCKPMQGPLRIQHNRQDQTPLICTIKATCLMLHSYSECALDSFDASLGAQLNGHALLILSAFWRLSDSRVASHLLTSHETRSQRIQSKSGFDRLIPGTLSRWELRNFSYFHDTSVVHSSLT